MYGGWIKLHRKLLDNKIYNEDPTSWRIFEYLLLMVDKDTGKYDCGRFQLSERLKIKPSTVRDALYRLQKAKMVDIKSNNKFSEVYICKWKDYQNKDDTANDIKATSKRQQNDTKQEEENKRNIYSVLTIEISEILETKPTKGIESYVKEYPTFPLKDYACKANEWVRAGKGKVASLTWMNWVKRDAEKLNKKSEVIRL